MVQLRLLEHNIQAAPPIKDTGNDLIAVNGNVFRAIQVKTRTGAGFSWKQDELPEHFHILALVGLVFEGSRLLLDQSPIYLLGRGDVDKSSYSQPELTEHGFLMTPARVATLFSDLPPAHAS